MDVKKTFGIGAVVLLIMVTFVPMINALHIEENNNFEPEACGDFEFSADITRCEFIEYSLQEDRVKYEIDWKVNCLYWNVLFKVNVKCELYGKESHQVYASWNEKFTLFDHDFREGTVGLWLTSSENASIDQERYFAGTIIVFRIIILDDDFHNNVDEEFVKFWRDDPDYIPTEPQIEAGAPRWGKQVYHSELPDIYYVDILGGNGGRILSNLLLSKRMGWVGQGLGYIAKMSLDLAAIFGASVTFLGSISSDLTTIGEWFLEVMVWFENLISGIIIPGLLILLINNFINCVWPAIQDMAIKAGIYAVAFIEIFDKLWNDANETWDWSLDSPWHKDITMVITVNNVVEGETVQVECRDMIQTKTRAVGEPDKKLRFNFTVTSTPQGNEIFQEGIHNCQVKITGNKHNGDIQSRRLLSYAFANGSLNWVFPRPGDKSRTMDRTNIVDKLKNWLKNRPFYDLINKILDTTIYQNEIKKQTQKYIDFDLDGLVNNVLDEEAQYAPYDVEYKTYYPGVPKDPNIVYYSSDQIIVAFKSYVDITNIEEVEGFPIVDKLLELNTVIVEIYAIDPEDFVELVQQREDVEYAELNFVYQTCFIPNDPKWNQQWNMKAINCPQAWDIQKGDGLAYIAIVDTGVWYDHEDRNYWMLDGYDFVNNDDDPIDDCYVAHGTHCAGIATAQINNGIGIAGVSDSSIIPIKVLDSEGAGYASHIAKGIVYASTKCDADVISMSLGGYGVSVLLHTACDFAYYIKDTLIVAAAGNDGLSRLCFPARFNSVISVGAVDKNLNLCFWSNHGSDLDLVAPGDEILSTIGNNGYTELSGTSMATPHVAGVAALYYSSKPFDSASIVKGTLFSTAIDIGADCKYGLVNAYGAVKNNKALNSYNFPIMNNFIKFLKNILNK